MSKGRISRVFAFEVEERLPIDPDQLPLPTLDERVNLYLCAVHGKRDFTSKEVSDARNLMLDAMATDIAAKSGINLSDQPRDSKKAPETAHPDEIVAARVSRVDHWLDYGSNTAFEDSVGYQASYESIARPHQSVRHAKLSVAQGPPYESEVALARAFIPRPAAVVPPPSAREGKVAKRIFHICGAAAGAAAVAVLLITILPTTTTKRIETPTAPQSALPLETHAKETTSVQQLGPEEIARVQQLGPVEIAHLLQLGRKLIADGDISLARSVLRQGAEAGGALAALELGGTYDPIVLEELGRRTVSGKTAEGSPRVALESVASPEPRMSAPDMTFAADIAMARNWYQKARDLGSTEAAARLDRLAGRDGQAGRRPSTPGPIPLPRPAPNR